MELILKNNFQSLAEKLRFKNILITGASGYIGKNLLEILMILNKKYNLQMKIHGLSRAHHAHQGMTSWICHDINNPLNFEMKLDAIIHAATPVDLNLNPQALYQTIVNGTRHVLDFARNNHVSLFLNLSSGAVYDPIQNPEGPYTEGMRPESIEFDLAQPYGSGKRHAEILVSHAASDTIKTYNARGFAFSGRHLPLNKHFAIGNFVSQLLKGQKIIVKGDGQSVRSYMDSEDMVYWLLTILFCEKRQENYNVGSDQPISIAVLAETIARQGSHIMVKIENSIKSDKPGKYLPDTKKAQRELGLKINVPLVESIEKMIFFHKSIKD